MALVAVLRFFISHQCKKSPIHNGTGESLKSIKLISVGIEAVSRQRISLLIIKSENFRMFKDQFPAALFGGTFYLISFYMTISIQDIYIIFAFGQMPWLFKSDSRSTRVLRSDIHIDVTAIFSGDFIISFSSFCFASGNYIYFMICKMSLLS